MVYNSVATVISSGLCHGCGLCVGVCPTRALNMTYSGNDGIFVPQVQDERCVECGLCLRVCPGHEVGFAALNVALFGDRPVDSRLGAYLACFSGYATDPEVRKTASSGGCTTALLLNTLEQGLIDGAVVTKMDAAHQLRTKTFIARTRAEILAASGSKYCPVTMASVFEELQAAENGRYAFVGLPCHIHGLRKLQELKPEVTCKVTLVVGLFCARGITGTGTNFVLGDLGIDEREVRLLSYRGDGWPGAMQVECDRQRVRVPYT